MDNYNWAWPCKLKIFKRNLNYSFSLKYLRIYAACNMKLVQYPSNEKFFTLHSEHIFYVSYLLLFIINPCSSNCNYRYEFLIFCSITECNLKVLYSNNIQECKSLGGWLHCISYMTGNKVNNGLLKLAKIYQNYTPLFSYFLPNTRYLHDT